MTARPDSLPADELRALIRDVLHDVLPAAIGRAPSAVAADGASAHPPADAVSARAPGPVPPATVPPATVPPATVPPATVPPGTTPTAPPSGLPPAPPRAAPPHAAPTPAVPPPTARQPTAHQRPAAALATSARAGTTRQVRLDTDADVREFALEIVRLADNPARRRDLLTGRLTFTLARRDGGEAAATSERRIETGAVTERAVQSAAKAGQRLVLGPRAVLTPLARDRALALGVPIEKER
jgi:hypothetical protein